MKCYFIESLLFAWLVVFDLEAVNLILSEQSMVKLRLSLTVSSSKLWHNPVSWQHGTIVYTNRLIIVI